MSLQTRLEALVSAIGADIKAYRSALGTLSSLTTTDKTSLVTAINEVNAKPSGGGSVKSVEVNFGTVAKKEAVVTISDAAFVVGSKLIVSQSGDAATGRQADENEMESFHAVGTVTSNGNARISVTALPNSRLQGRFKLNYMMG